MSWESTIERAETAKAMGLQPRFVPREVHDEAVYNLAKNAKIIFTEGKPEFLEIYSRNSKLFDSKLNSPNEIESAINNELNSLNKKVSLEKNYQIEFTYNRELSEQLGQKSYNVLVNGVKADDLLNKDNQLSKALEGLATHKDMQQKGITAGCSSLFHFAVL